MKITPINYNYTNRSYSINNSNNARPSFGIITDVLPKPKVELPYTKDDMVEFFAGVCAAIDRNITKKNEKLMSQLNEDVCKVFESITQKHRPE